LREREPVHCDEQIKQWVLTRAQDVDHVLRDRSMAVDPRKANEDTYMRRLIPPAGRDPSMIMLTPRHTPA